MFGIVIGANLQTAFLQVPGLSEPVTAPFTEIRNATPKTLDMAEVVEFALHRSSGGELGASAILILAGSREQDAIRRMTPSAPWFKPTYQRQDRPAQSAGQKREKQ